MTVSSANEKAQAHFFRAMEFWQNEDHANAAGEALLASKANNAPFPEAELLVAHCYSVGEGFSGEDLVQQLEKVVKRDPDDAGSWLLLALQTRDVRDRLFQGAIERKSASWHRDADKYFKKSQKAFQEALSRFPAFARSQRHVFSFFLSPKLPIIAGDYVAQSDTMPIKGAYDWYQVVADYDVPTIIANARAEELFTDEETLTELEVELEEMKSSALRKKMLLENSATAKTKRNTGVERTMNQKLFLNIAIAAVVFLLLCWGLYALIT